MCGTDNVKRSASSSAIASDAVINLDHGDPMIFESYWRKMGDKCRVVMEGHESLSYFADVKNLCWYMEPKLEEEIRRLHHTVGNAVVEDHYVVVGTGSSQLIQAALYALSSPDQPHPNSIVSAVPYYSSYVEIVEILRSGLYKWGGDARTFDKEGPYIELITSPNNPDGIIREATVNRGDQGKLVHDLAYYWPQYTPITSPANFDIMLFTTSKCTGHAGSRIGWALVKDKEVAKRMIKFVEVNTIGVSKESQLRTAKILGVVSDSCLCVDSPEIENFFEYGQRIMAERWKRLRDVVKRNEVFSLPKYPIVYCHFTREYTETHPAFAWMKCKEKIEDCEKFLREKKIATRSGRRFGTDPHHVRVSMLNKDEEFELFLERLKDIQVDESQ